MLSAWFGYLYGMADDRDPEKTRPENLQALAQRLAARMEKLPAGAPRDVARLLWIKTADLDEARLTEFGRDPDLEVRRMALALRIRAVEKGPKDLVLKGIADPAPEIRRMAIAAAIPRVWRSYIPDPTSNDLVAGQQVDDRRSWSTPDAGKVPKVIELPVPTLEQMLLDTDEEVRVITAFLMAMEGGDQGISILVRRWRSAPDYSSTQMLARAIGLAWDDSLTPHLTAIYQYMAHEDESYRIRQLYRETEGLAGPQLKKLRQRIRREYPDVGQ